MMSREGRTVTKRAVAIITMAGALGIGGALLLPAVAAAEPLPEPPVVPTGGPPPPATIGTPLAQSGTPNAGGISLPDVLGSATLAQNGDPNPGPFGLPGVVTDPGRALAQNPIPSAPGANLGVPISTGFDSSYLLSQNEVPSAPGQGTVVGAPPGADGSANALGYLGELHQANISGRLVGIGFGFRPKEQLGQPLPGTAPAPGIPIPPGLGENLPAPPPIVPPVPPPA